MFKITRTVFGFLWMAIFFFASNSTAQSDYRNYSSMTKELQDLQRTYASNCSLQSLSKTIGGYDIWGLTLFSGNHQDKPAIAIVAGVDGNNLLSSEMAVYMAENILANHLNLLENTTFYIFPNMSPNASEHYFSKIKFHGNGNARKTDDDRDGRLNEDPYEDLNNDGLITLFRVEDVTGDYLKLKDDERILVKTDKQNAKLGTYKVFTEGIDNDKDGKFNEDGNGGINFNKNFSYKFSYFKPGAGEYPVSEKENRALLDFLYEQWNIYAILTLGPDNNLSTPLKYNKASASKRVITSILKNDADLNKFISKKYAKITVTKKDSTGTSQGGSFFEWSYFHFGKLAMSTPGWWVPKFKGDSINKASKNKQANFLKWAAKEKLSNYFIDWKEIDHPDFPNKKVEIGGIVPFKMSNPPYYMVDSISIKHTNFIVEFAKLQPDISLQNIRSEAVNNELTRITLDVHNGGYLPTHTEMGQRSRWLRKIKVSIDLKNGQELIAGKKIALVNSIAGDSSLQFTWLIKGKGTVEIEAGTSHTGSDKAIINLK